MTAPDSRDSVERVVAEMRERSDTSDDCCYGTIGTRCVRDWADRLQALARGPQRAGGEDAPPCPVWLAGKDVSHAWAAGWNARNPHYAALQAEVARLLIRIETLRSTADRATVRADDAEAALLEARR